jgi:hypothetical protein
MSARERTESEYEFALKLADAVLENPHRDPDDDLAVLARQFLRNQEPGTRQLRAAAPELLTALKQIVSVLDSPEVTAIWERAINLSGPELLSKYDGPYVDLDAARAAIANAESHKGA